MKAYFYPKSIYTSIATFADQFNNMSVRVFDNKTDRIVGVKDVPMTLTAKEKIASILAISDVNDVDPQMDNYLPRISINPSGFNWDPNRMRGKFERRLLNIEYTDDNGATRLFQTDIKSIPWNITFEVTVWSKYMADAIQLFENIAVWFAPEDHISFKERNFNIEHKSKVTLNNMVPNNTFELGEKERRIITHNYTFTMETVLFKPVEFTPAIHCNIIKIAGVPCKKVPFYGDAIIVKDDGTDSVIDPTLSTIIADMDKGDAYDLMVKHWETANNTMRADNQVSDANPIGTFKPCVDDNCIEPLTPRPEWDPQDAPEPCEPPKQPSRFVKNDDETISTYHQEIVVCADSVMKLVSYRSTFESDGTIIEQDVIIPNEEYPSGNDIDGDGVIDE